MTTPAVIWTPFGKQPAPNDDTPPDAYGKDFAEYECRTAFRNLCQLVGFEEAVSHMACVILTEKRRYGY